MNINSPEKCLDVQYNCAPWCTVWHTVEYIHLSVSTTLLPPHSPHSQEQKQDQHPSSGPSLAPLLTVSSPQLENTVTSL